MQLVAETELIARCRLEADMEGSESPTDVQIGTWLKAEAKQLYNLLLRVKGQSYYARRAQLTTVTNVAEVALPSDFYQLIEATLVIAPNNRCVLTQVQDSELAVARSMAPGVPERCRLGGMFAIDGAPTYTEVLEVFGTPRGAFAIDLDYVPTFRTVTSGGVFYNGINGFEEWMICGVVILMRAREQLGVSAWRERRARIDQDIQALGGKRDRRPAVMVDVYNDLGSPARSRGWPWWL